MSQLFNVEAEIADRRRRLQRGQSVLVILGDGRGTQDINYYADRQRCWVRYAGEKTSTGYKTIGAPFRALANVNYSPEINVAVWISWKVELGYFIERPDPEHLERTGRSMHLLNASDPNNQFISQGSLLTLLSRPLAFNSLKVNVGQWIYTYYDGSAWVSGQYRGSNATDRPHADFSSAVPGTANHHRYGLVYFNIVEDQLGNDPVGVVTSTSKSIFLTLGNADILECLNALPNTKCVPIKAYRLETGQTGIRGHRDDRDVRNFANTPAPTFDPNDALFPRTLSALRSVPDNKQIVVSSFVVASTTLTVAGLLTVTHGTATLTGTGTITISGSGELKLVS